MNAVSHQFWMDRMDAFQAEWVDVIRADVHACEERRIRAAYDTGTITLPACMTLRALCEWRRPKVVIEIGTFIGTSTMAIARCRSVEQIYTCDKRNDCGPDRPGIERFPFTASTSMLRELVRRGVVADLWFFDGRIELADIELIDALSTQETVFAFDDYYQDERGRDQKGIINIRRWLPSVPTHRLIEPMTETTIAVLVP